MAVAAAAAEKSLTQRILEAIPPEEVAGGAGGAASAPNTWEALQRADAAWGTLKNSSGSGPSGSEGSRAGGGRPFVREHASVSPPGTAEGGASYDVVVCGGTLGIFIAAALAVKHGPTLSVAVVERS